MGFKLQPVIFTSIVWIVNRIFMPIRAFWLTASITWGTLDAHAPLTEKIIILSIYLFSAVKRLSKIIAC